MLLDSRSNAEAREMSTSFEIAADLHTPVSAFLRLQPMAPRYLLETVESGLQGRYSFIGFGEATEVEVRPDGVYRGDDHVSPDYLDGLRKVTRDGSAPFPPSDGGGFSGGLVGAAGFDMVRGLSRLDPSPFSPPRSVASYVITESVLVFDHLTRRIGVFHASETAHRDVLDEVNGLLRRPLAIEERTGSFQTPAATMRQNEYVNKVATAQAHIAAGDVYQLVLSIGFSGETDLDPFAVYRALRSVNPSPYMYFLDVGGRQIVGSSPEALAKLDGRNAQIWPIAGTRPRGATTEEDFRLEQELLADPKEAAEHVMLVDLARNDLGRSATAGSVKVAPFRAIERYSHVMHMVTGVTGELRPDLDAFDLFASTFPAGTVVGAPKRAAIELIDQLEPAPRDLYSGAVGWFGRDGGMDQAITIRTAVFEEGRYSFQAGAGIVADSDPESEYEEVLSKGAALRSALATAAEGI